MSAVLLALAAAVAFGVADFLAGVLSRRRHFSIIGLISQLSAGATVLAVLPWFSGGGPSAVALGWGVVSGLGGGVGSLALYRGLGHGQMNVVAPLSAVGGAALPALAGIALGERPSPLALTGIGLALPALWLVSRPTGSGTSTAAGVRDGLLAGAGFAVLFIALDRAGDASGLWPVAVGQLASLLMVAGFVLVSRRTRPTAPGGPATPASPAATGSAVGGALLVGVLSVTATFLYFLATHAGLLTVAAVLTSLYPAVTVLLAATFLRERTSRVQVVGLIAATAAVVLVTVA